MVISQHVKRNFIFFSLIVISYYWFVFAEEKNQESGNGKQLSG
jgi:hypothetical protein